MLQNRRVPSFHSPVIKYLCLTFGVLPSSPIFNLFLSFPPDDLTVTSRYEAG